MNNERAAFCNDSNNGNDPNKNLCALAVCRAFGVDSGVRYLHTYCDILRAFRKTYKMSATPKKLYKGRSVGGIRKILKDIGMDVAGAAITAAYVVYVDGHVLLMDTDGNTIVDTAPRKRDKRKILKMHAIGIPTSILTAAHAKVIG